MSIRIHPSSAAPSNCKWRRRLLKLLCVMVVVMPCLAISQVSSAMGPSYEYTDRSLFAISFKAGYFLPLNSTIDQVYGGAPELEVGLAWQVVPRWAIVSAGRWLSKDGHSLVGRDFTSMTIGSIFLGGRYSQPIGSRWIVYFDAGPRYGFVSFDNRSDFVDREVRNHGLGFSAEASCLYALTPKRWWIQTFIDYTWLRLSFTPAIDQVVGRSRVQLDGLSFGGGLLVAF
jgi:hypothetical protein